jgi:hypothetical protein
LQVAAAARPVELAKRERKVVNYNERIRVAREASSGEEFGPKDDADEQEAETPLPKKVWTSATPQNLLNIPEQLYNS